MSLPLRPPLITWVSGETSLTTAYVVASSRVNSTGSGPVVQYFWLVGLVPDLDEVHLAVDVPHDVA